jgi:hypothetical protein
VPFRPGVQEQILDALKTRAPHVKNCAVCDTREWTLIDGFISIPVFDTPNVSDYGSVRKALLATALVCSNCGNIIFLSLLALGLENIQYEYGLMRSSHPQPPPDA